MQHTLFKPKSFDEGKHAVVGDCNGIPMEERWKVETPLFARAILSNLTKKRDDAFILDYGCGVGRLAKEILHQYPSDIHLIGVDASEQMCTEAEKYVADQAHFDAYLPTCLSQDIEFDLVYCIYVLQHCPSIEIRELLARIHHHLKDDGVFIYCSSDYRMAIRFDSGGFFDDRFLGVNLQEEISRLFDYEKELFDRATLDANPVLKTMIEGGLQHPAKVYRKKKIDDYLHIAAEEKPAETSPAMVSTRDRKEARKLLLINRLAPGDILVMTNAIRDLHKAFPGKYQTDVRTPANEIFDHNPYITKLVFPDSDFNSINGKLIGLPPGDMSTDSRSQWIGDILAIDMQYPMIHRSGTCGRHFSEGHRDWLEQILGERIPQTELTPEIYLSLAEQTWVSPVSVKSGYGGKYWVINAGSKGDYTLKQYPYYQEVVDLLKDKVKFVQIGEKVHNHMLLNGTIDMLGKTTMRELFRVIYFSEGVLTCVSLPMHIAAAFRKPCVVVAGAREGTRWELYPNHRFIYLNGCLPCATYDGCWRSKQSDCDNKVGDVPRCMTMIKPQHVADNVLMYYDGGILKP